MNRFSLANDLEISPETAAILLYAQAYREKTVNQGEEKALARIDYKAEDACASINSRIRETVFELCVSSIFTVDSTTTKGGHSYIAWDNQLDVIDELRPTGLQNNYSLRQSLTAARNRYLKYSIVK